MDDNTELPQSESEFDIWDDALNLWGENFKDLCLKRLDALSELGKIAITKEVLDEAKRLYAWVMIWQYLAAGNQINVSEVETIVEEAFLGAKINTKQFDHVTHAILRNRNVRANMSKLIGKIAKELEVTDNESKSLHEIIENFHFSNKARETAWQNFLEIIKNRLNSNFKNSFFQGTVISEALKKIIKRELSLAPKSGTRSGTSRSRKLQGYKPGFLTAYERVTRASLNKTGGEFFGQDEWENFWKSKVGIFAFLRTSNLGTKYSINSEGIIERVDKNQIQEQLLMPILLRDRVAFLEVLEEIMRTYPAIFSNDTIMQELECGEQELSKIISKSTHEQDQLQDTFKKQAEERRYEKHRDTMKQKKEESRNQSDMTDEKYYALSILVKSDIKIFDQDRNDVKIIGNHSPKSLYSVTVSGEASEMRPGEILRQLRNGIWKLGGGEDERKYPLYVRLTLEYIKHKNPEVNFSIDTSEGVTQITINPSHTIFKEEEVYHLHKMKQEDGDWKIAVQLRTEIGTDQTVWFIPGNFWEKIVDFENAGSLT